MKYIIDIRDFNGWDETGANSSAGCFRRAVAEARALNKGPSFGSVTKAGILHIPKGIWIVDSIDATNCASFEIRGDQTNLYAADQPVPSPIIDATGANNCHVSGIALHAQTPGGQVPAVQPTCAVLLAESTTASSNKNRFDDVGSVGSFSGPAVAILGSTDNGFYNCGFQQDWQSSPCLFGGVYNAYAVASRFTSVNPAPGNCGDNSFFQCEFHGHRSAAALAPTSQFWGVDNWRFFGGNHDNSGPQHVLFNANNKLVLYAGVKFYSESGHAADDLLHSANAGARRVGLMNPNVEDNAFSRYLVNGDGGPDFADSWMAGVPVAMRSGPYVSQFSAL